MHPAMTLLAMGLLTAVPTASAALSIPSKDATMDTSLRSELIRQRATQIQNEPRVIPIDGVDYPLYHGPVWRPGSLTEQVQDMELAHLEHFDSMIADEVATLAGEWADDFVTIHDFAAFYDDVGNLVEKPMSTDNSDPVFGAQRLAIKGFNMRLVKPDEYVAKQATDSEAIDHKDDRDDAENQKDIELSLDDDALAAICGQGVTLRNIRERQSLFVSEYEHVADFNDPRQPHKFVPNVIGFFCFNHDTQQLLPVEIRTLETGLAYTPLDYEEEWTLAKMALETAEISVQEMQHMAETHALTVPMRVEAYRTMSEEHPVFALLVHHVFADFALEKLSTILLLNTTTEVDLTFGFGATGATRFLNHQITTDAVTVSLANDFPTDIKRRGLEHIPTHKYVKYGRKYYGALDAFVADFLALYYPTENDLLQDMELQNWAAACAQVPHLREFPSAFTSIAQLRKLLTHVLFQSAFKHHTMNGSCSWHAVSIPYSLPALWQRLPPRKLAKGEHIDLTEYTVPRSIVADQVRSSAMFYRPIPVTETLLDAYRTAPFIDEPRLAGSIFAFERRMRAIDTELMETEPGAVQHWPLQLYRPTMLAYYTWI